MTRLRLLAELQRGQRKRRQAAAVQIKASWSPRVNANKRASDKSQQNIGGDPGTPRTISIVAALRSSLSTHYSSLIIHHSIPAHWSLNLLADFIDV